MTLVLYRKRTARRLRLASTSGVRFRYSRQKEAARGCGGRGVLWRVAKITARDVKQLSCSSQAKSVIQHCIGPRRKRFQDAARMLDALRKQEPLAKRVGVHSLAGQRVVFTGALRIPRSEAKKLLRKAGGIVQRRVAHNTTVLVIGKNSPHFKADTKGQKLLDLDLEYERGHRIATIGEARFLALTNGQPCV